MEESISLCDIYEKLKMIERTMATKQELTEAFETMAILSNEDTMNQIESSESDLKKGKFKQIRSVNDL